MKKFLTLLTILCFSGFYVSTIAQTAAEKSVKGQVSSQKAVDAATVLLLNVKDSSIVTSAVTNNSGTFDMPVKKDGKYLVSIQAIGYNQYYTETFDINTANPVYTIKPAILTAQAVQLGGVVVTTKKPFIELKIDKTVVNVDASPTNVGLSALDVLEKSPGITVDKDGNVSLRGKQGVMILIDGRPSYLSGADLANYLKNLSSSNLDQIEIMTQPPAKYDASGNAGVINIKTKKTKVVGLNGSVTVGGGQGYYPKANESFNINYRTGKVNLFGNYGYNYYKSKQSLDLVRNFRDQQTQDIESIYKQQTNMSRINQTHSFKAGVDYYASKKTTLGIVVNGYISPSTNNSYNTTDIYDADGVLQSQTLAPSNSTGKWRNIGTNFNLTHTFDSTGRELTADVDYVQYHSTSNQMFYNYFYDPKGDKIQPDETLRGMLPSDINIYSAKADYTHPLKGNAKFEAGIKTSYVKTDNNAQYDNLIGGDWILDTGRSNHFVYTENINAAYANLSKQFSKKWSAQAGLRLENTNAKGNQLTTGQTFTRNYTQLFPTAYLGYTLNDKNQFSVSYGRRIERPDYESLNPFYYFLDKYTYQVGNPYLKPQFSNNFELTHSFKSILNTTLSYSTTTDIIQEVLEQVDSTHTSFVKRSNIASQRSFGLSMNASVPVTKWWRSNLYGQVINNRYKGFVNYGDIDVEATGFMANMQNQFTLPKGWTLELSGFYRSKMVEGILIARPMGKLDFAVAKSIMKKKGMIRVNVSDFLNLQSFRGYSRYQNVDVTIHNRWDNRVVNVSFTYRFNKGQSLQHHDHSGAGDEKSRVKGSN
ncbi:MAG TPA: TonB-dependent receptor [Chitinophagaceae bacterium]|nr:TonB-dependent receptor [Chitinophagaceae bacterium]